MIKGDEFALKILPYNLASYYMRDNRHGGCCILVKNTHAFRELKEVSQLSIKGIIECCAVELVDHKINILCIYRSPKQSTECLSMFFHRLNDIFLKYYSGNKKTLLCGDFNIDILKKDKRTMDFETLVLRHNCKFEFKQPTRIVSKSCIDNIIHNARGSKGEIIELALSDHTAQIIKCPVKKYCRLKFWYILKRDYSAENRHKFITHLKQLTFLDVFENDDPNMAYNIFHDWFKLLYDLCFPVMRVKMYSTVKPKWLSRGLKLCSKRKRALLWQYRLKPNDTNKKTFKDYAKLYRLIINKTQRSKNNFYISSSTNKAKASWSVINKNKYVYPKESVPKLIIDGKEIQDPKEIATIFNNYFIDVVKTDNSKSSNNLININSNLNTIFMTPVLPCDIKLIINSLKNTNSHGHDGIITKIVKDASEIISPILCHLINLSLVNGIFPDILKLSVIKPLHKKDDPCSVNNYRPVALLTIFSKIYERVIYKLIYKFLESNNVFANEQFGFRKNKTINMAIFNFLQKVMSNMDKRLPVIALYMDISKAFDHVDHQILMMKMYSYGIRGKAHDLIKSYLTDRKQITQITKLCLETKMEQKYHSNIRNVLYGVPQGSILGPLLFLIYINDLPQVTKHSMTLFADDSTVLFTGNKVTNFDNEINVSLKLIVEWFEKNNLKINLNKTTLMNFRQRDINTNMLNINYMGTTISETDTVKFLGLFIDRKMKWKEHIDHVCKKLYKFSYALCKLSKCVKQQTVLLAYHAYVAAALRYGVIFWGNSTDKELAFKAQKKCVRAICNMKKTDSCKPHFKELKLLTLPSIYIIECCLFVKSNINNFEFKSKARHAGKLNIVPARTHLFQQSFFCKAATIYNKIPPKMRSIPDIEKFKEALQKLLLDKCYYSLNEFLNDKI